MEPFRSVLRALDVGSRLLHGAVELGVWLFILILMAYLLRQPDIWPSPNDVA